MRNGRRHRSVAIRIDDTTSAKFMPHPADENETPEILN